MSISCTLVTATETAPTCSYAIWRRAHALVIVQQAAFDVQFGSEVNLWLEPSEGPLPQIRPPLIDWLVKRDHDRAAFGEAFGDSGGNPPWRSSL
jgi:hypothetical protein